MENEEIAAEQAATKEIKEDEVRTKVIEEFGFDPEVDKERIDKLVAKEVENHKKLSSAIGQKIKHRTEAEALRNDPRLKGTATPTEAKPADVDIDKKLDEKLAERDLAKIKVPDEIKKEIKEWADFKKISIEQAIAAPHLVTKITAYEKEQEAEEAAISRTHRSDGKSTYSLEGPPKVDMSSPEGRKEYDDWKKWAVKNGG